MIAVIADDFTGAAEIGGVGVRYGLKVLIETVVAEDYDVDLLVIATNTRSMPVAEATQEVVSVLRQIEQLKPDFIYKKIDSVLRGHVTKELEAQMAEMQVSRALVVAPNPLVGRKIENGTYYVEEVPLDQTFFKEDPDFPVKSSFIHDLLRSEKYPVYLLNVGCSPQRNGIFVANVSNHEELKQWAASIDGTMVVAGGSGFFDALLETTFQYQIAVDQPLFSMGDGSLFIFGSMFPKNQELVEKFNKKNVVRSNMPEEIYYQTGDLNLLVQGWAGDVAASLEKGFTVMVTIDYPLTPEAGLSLRIRDHIGALVAAIAARYNLTDLFIEGGATTSTVLKSLNITKLIPFYEADFGVIQMRADGYPQLCITTKPGSYLWPEKVDF